MLKKLPKPPVSNSQVPSENEKQLQQSNENIQPDHVETKLLAKLMSKDSLYVTFSGVIESGYINDEQALSVLFIAFAGDDWKLINGQKTGISQTGSSYNSSNKNITWNFPFEVAYESTNISGWPQLLFVVSGTDFFGRSIVRGYGNIHLPSTEGSHTRKVRLFKPLPQSIITGIFGYLNGCIAQFKQPEKILAMGEGRQVSRVQSVGFLNLKVQTVRYNFALFGYS